MKGCCGGFGIIFRGIAFLVTALAVTGLVHGDEEKRQDTGREAVRIVATVGDEAITVEEYQVNLQAAYRQRFFHGKVPQEQEQAFRREVIDALIERILLRKEAVRRGLEPDAAWVEGQLDRIAGRYKNLPRWEAQRETLMAGLQRQLEEQSLIERLRREVEARVKLEDEAVLQYYREHPDIFTTPQRVRVSTILLKVEPWAPEVSWQAAGDEARRLVEKLRKGADFADLARLHSGDESAARGGDLGYVHAGMLSAEAQAVVDDLEPGVVSEPVRLLRGYALFRLEARTPARLNEFSRVEARARSLLLRERKKQAWQETLAGLRKNTPIMINEALLVTGIE